MLKRKIPLTQQNYIELAYMGDKHSIEELGVEEIAELPEGFEDWPRSRPISQPNFRSADFERHLTGTEFLPTAHNYMLSTALDRFDYCRFASLASTLPAPVLTRRSSWP